MDVPMHTLIRLGMRIDHYLMSHQVIASWSIEVQGMVFKAEHGSDKIERTLYWSDIKDFERDTKHVEFSALRGLSS